MYSFKAVGLTLRVPKEAAACVVQSKETSLTIGGGMYYMVDKSGEGTGHVLLGPNFLPCGCRRGACGVCVV